MFDLISIAHAATEAAQTEAQSGGVLGTLGINWKLFVAQLVNFSVVMWVLWKFVFGPVGKKLEERRLKIDKALKDAQDVEKQKTEFEAWREEEMRKTRTQAAEALTAAQKEAGQLREKLLAETKTEQEKLGRQAQEQIKAEQQKSVLEIKSQIGDLVILATEKILKEKLDNKRDQELVKKAIDTLK
ncbi:MAG: F0F1 ATP synthase subunit B [Patescibacteria group bacterium]|nr:F0F1 ATP synthase subunit B [Patescibacteria group bacterium]